MDSKEISKNNDVSEIVALDRLIEEKVNELKEKDPRHILVALSRPILGKATKFTDVEWRIYEEKFYKNRRRSQLDIKNDFYEAVLASLKKS
jgi:glucokinase